MTEPVRRSVGGDIQDRGEACPRACAGQPAKTAHRLEQVRALLGGCVCEECHPARIESVPIRGLGVDASTAVLLPVGALAAP